MATSKWSAIDASNLQEGIEDILRDYGDVVYQATEEGLASAEKILIKNLKAASPKKSGEFAKSWKGTGKKYKMVRFVGNTKTVISKGKSIPLSNIFEYSTTGHYAPFINKTYENSINEMAAAVVAEIKKEA